MMMILHDSGTAMYAMQKAINQALKIAYQNGQSDGGHHKMWVIDQMVRALTGEKGGELLPAEVVRLGQVDDVAA